MTSTPDRVPKRTYKVAKNGRPYYLESSGRTQWVKMPPLTELLANAGGDEAESQRLVQVYALGLQDGASREMGKRNVMLANLDSLVKSMCRSN